MKRLPGKTDSRLPSPAHAPPTPCVCTHAPAAGRDTGGGTGGGGRVAAKARGARSPPAVSTSRDKAARRRRRRGKEGEAHTLKTGVNGQLSNGGSPGSPWTPGQTVNTFLNKSFLLPFRPDFRPRIGELSFCFARIILRPAEASLGWGWGKGFKSFVHEPDRALSPLPPSLPPALDFVSRFVSRYRRILHY